MWFINSDDNLYQGEMQPGDREATTEEIDAWLAAQANSESIKSECYRRINLNVSPQALANIHAYIGSLLTLVVVESGSLSSGQEDDVTSFRLLQSWIGDMLADAAGLVDDPDYRDNSNWTDFPEGLPTFVARF